MSTTLKLTSYFGLGALAFWFSAAAVASYWHDIGLITVLIPVVLASMSTLMFAEASVTWSYARRKFHVTRGIGFLTFGLGIASSAATLAVGAGLNLGWTWLVPSVTILPTLILTAILWYLGAALCVVCAYERVSALESDRSDSESHTGSHADDQPANHGALQQAG